MELVDKFHILKDRTSYLFTIGGNVKKITTLLLSGLFLAVCTFASGFQINEHGARGLAMGGAFVGLANSPMTIYLNPAGITQLNGTRLSLGATYIGPSSTFKGPNGNLSRESSLVKRFFTPINFYFTQQLDDNWYLGFAINNPFGLGTEWPSDWVGRYSTVKTEIRTFNFTPVIAYKFSEQFSASVGFSVSYADVLINKKIQGFLPNPTKPGTYLTFPDADIEMKGDNISYGFIAGLLYKPSSTFSVGASFKSGIKYDFEGDAKLTLDPATDALSKQVAGAAFPSGKIKAPLTVPYVAIIGISYKANENLTIVSDFQYNGWKSYDKLEITFEEWKNPVTKSNVSSSHRDFENNYLFRLGGEYKVSDCLDLRAGILYDKNPVKDERLDPTLPDADRVGLTLGAGYKITEKLSVDIAYFYLHFVERTINNSQEIINILPYNSNTKLNGVYSSNAHLVGLNFNYNF